PAARRRASGSAAAGARSRRTEPDKAGRGSPLQNYNCNLFRSALYRPSLKTMPSDVLPETLVVGGGIGGLSAALCLALRGGAVTLVERSKSFAEVGAGIQLAPNATRILRNLG